MAYDVALSIAEKPGDIPFNPFIICGKSGTGKTHLVQAVGNEIKRKFPDKNIMYFLTGDFISYLGYSENVMRAGRIVFYLRKTDVLIVDDVHLLQNECYAHETLYTVLDYLYLKGKQIILTSFTPDDDSESLFFSHFQWGISVEMLKEG